MFPANSHRKSSKEVAIVISKVARKVARHCRQILGRQQSKVSPNWRLSAESGDPADGGKHQQQHMWNGSSERTP